MAPLFLLSISLPTVLQPFSIPGAALFIGSGFGMVYYFRNEKEKVERKRIAEQSKEVGKPKVGGQFELLDHNGKPFVDEDIKGGFTLVSDRNSYEKFFPRGRNQNK